MSILIKGMEMPKNCICCDLSHEDNWCPAKQDYVDRYSYDTCPLVTVPPHGRLGDLDKLEQVFVDIDNAPYSGFDGSEPFYSAEDAAQIIRLSPTIIPAEEGET